MHKSRWVKSGLALLLSAGMVVSGLPGGGLIRGGRAAAAEPESVLQESAGLEETLRSLEADVFAEAPAVETTEPAESAALGGAEAEEPDLDPLQESLDGLTEFSTTSAKDETTGITTTTSRWDFGTAKNTGKTTKAGDTFNGIVVAGQDGRVIFDKGKDLNVKNTSNTSLTGTIFVPIKADTNVVRFTIDAVSNDNSRYVTIGSFDSDVKLVDNADDEEHLSATFTYDLKDYVTDAAGEVTGRFIPFYSHGNFKIKSLTLEETDAVTIVGLSGSLSGAGSSAVTGLRFKNMDDDSMAIIETAVAGGRYSVELPNGYRYVASVMGTSEYKIDPEMKFVDLRTGNNAAKTQDLTIVEQVVIKISGSFTISPLDNAVPVSADTLKAVLVPTDTTLESLELALVKGSDDYHYTYEADIIPKTEYSVELTGANDYEVTAKIDQETASAALNITATGKPLHTVSLTPVTHNLAPVAGLTGLTVRNMKDDYSYSFTGLSDPLSVQVRDGLYEVTAVTVTGSYAPYEHFEVKGADVTEEKLYLRDTAEKPAVEYKPELKVGATEEYRTITDALDVVKRMARTEGQRVKIVLSDALYREQVVVDVPYVTFASSRDGGSTITWYYGLGGDSYYSAYLDTSIDKNHLFYDEAHAVDKYESATVSQTPGNWGGTVNLKDTADYFRAENITFENSFNFYITEEEKADIAESGALLDRKAEGADPTLYKSKERACVMYNRGADKIEFYNCSFLSSQDTIYTGDANEDSYFYNCLLEGTTDYICGDGNAVFDSCRLALYGYSDREADSSVIVASKGSADKGYLFRYCTIYADPSDKIKTSKAAYLGRPWGTDKEKVAFINTIFDGEVILDKGWTKMNTVPSLNTDLHEYRSRFIDGTSVDLTKRVAENVGKDDQGTAPNYVLASDEGYGRSDYLRDWTPEYLGADYGTVEEQILRYNALQKDTEKLNKAKAAQKNALTKAYEAIQKGLLAKDQSKVTKMASDLKTAIDAISGEVKTTAAPTATLTPGTYDSSQITELKCATEGASIYYTTDGTVPSIYSKKYAGGVIIPETLTLQAVAVADGYVVSPVAKFDYVIEIPDDGKTTYALDVQTHLEISAKGAKKGTSEKAGTEEYFTVYYGAESEVGSRSGDSFDDGFVSTRRLVFRGEGPGGEGDRSVAFTTTYPNAVVKVWWKAAGDGRQVTILDGTGSAEATTAEASVNNAGYISELTLAKTGAHYLTNTPSSNYLFKIEVTEQKPNEKVLYGSDVATFKAGEREDGASEIAGSDGFFTLLYSAKSKVEDKNKEFADGYVGTRRINFGGDGAETTKNAVKFTTESPSDVTIYWAAGNDDRQMAILGADGSVVATTSEASKKDAAYISKLTLDAAGTYYLGGAGKNNYLFGVKIAEVKEVVRADWSTVPAPVIVSAKQDGGKINVVATSFLSQNGGDALYVDLLDEKGDTVETQNSKKADNTLEKEFSFTVAASGTYTAVARLARDGEKAEKRSAESEPVAFVLPLSAPAITSATNKGTEGGKGRLEVGWGKVAEAKIYDVEIVKMTGEGENATEQILTSAKNLTARETILVGLPLNETVTVRVYAVRGEDRSEAGTREILITGANDRTWAYTSYGDNAKATDSATVNEDGSISLKTPSSTKLVPASVDGVGFYYTKVNADDNFTLTAVMKVDEWPYDNGQEGFGLMAADDIGEHGDDAKFWNNSYQALVSQFQYNWDPTIKDAEGNYVGGVTNVGSDSVNVFQSKMRLGIGATVKTGVTLAEKQKAATSSSYVPAGFSSTQDTLETTVMSAVNRELPGITKDSTPDEVRAAFKSVKGVNLDGDEREPYGDGNLLDPDTAAKSVAKNTVVKIGSQTITPIKEARLQIQRNNTGYTLRRLSLESLGKESEQAVVYKTDRKGNRSSYLGTLNGKTVAPVAGELYEVLGEKTYYDDNRNNLSQLDKKTIYVGALTARKTLATVKELSIETVSAETDYPAEEKVLEEVMLAPRVLSDTTSNTPHYDLTFTVNANGTLNVVNGSKLLAQDLSVTSGKRVTIGSSLAEGDNRFRLVFTPTPGYAPGANQKLVISRDDPSATSVTLDHTVRYQKLNAEIIYVAPEGKGSGLSKDDPTDVYTATAFAAPGQKIYMAGGTYHLGTANGGTNKNIKIYRGTDGEPGKLIYWQTDPEDVAAGKRAVLDFKGATEASHGVTLVGSYWYLKDFDVTHSYNSKDGINVCGKYCTLENLKTYKNGNTGIQISRDGSDGRDLWPANNLILNCTSYLNYDAGFEDADGFAAKLTVGDGNRFVGCVAAYNADDGWDLFAKVENGQIGVVTLESCIAYKNGYLLGYRNGSDYEVFENPALSEKHKDAEQAVEFEAGNGNGFKLGGSGISGYHTLRNSISFENHANGIDSNSCPDIQVYNSVSYKNGVGISLNNYDTSVNSDYTVRGTITLANASADSIRELGNQVHSKIYNASNYFGGVNAADGSKITEAVFVSTDPANLGINTAKSVFVNRNDKGSVVYNGFLQLKKSADVTDPALKAVLEKLESEGAGAKEVSTAAEDMTSDVPEFTVFAGEVTTLADVVGKDINKGKLPAGYAWKYGETRTDSFAGATATFKTVNSSTGEDGSAVVHFVEVSGVTLTASELPESGGLSGDETLVLTAAPVISPAIALNAVDNHFAYTFKAKKSLGLSETASGNKLTLKRTSSSEEGIANYTVTLKATAGSKAKSYTSDAYSFTSRAAWYKFSYDLKGDAAETDGVIRVKEIGKTFTLENLKVENVGSKTDVKVTVGDSRVLKYSAGKFTAVSAGGSYILLTSAADKTVTKSIAVRVAGKDYSVGASLLSVDKAKSSGASFVVNSVSSGDIGTVSVKEVRKGASLQSDLKDQFVVSNIIGDVYSIAVKAVKDAKGNETATVPSIASGTYTVVLTTDSSEFEPVQVKVFETKPMATLKQTKKVNLFYKAGTTRNTGSLTAKSSQAGVALTQTAGSDFTISAAGKSYNVTMTSSAQKKQDAGTRLDNVLTLTASFDGYKKAYDREMTFRVSTEQRAPKYELLVDNSIFYTQLGIKDTKISVYDKTSEMIVTDAEITLASAKPAQVRANQAFTLEEDNGGYTLSTTKSGTAKLQVVDPEFSTDIRTKTDRAVILNAPIRISTAKPSVRFTAVSLNGQSLYAGKEQVSAPVIVNKAKDFTVRELQLTGRNEKAKALLPFLSLDMSRDELGQPVLVAKLQDSDSKTLEAAIKDGMIKKGSYTYAAQFVLNKLTGMKSNLTVKIAPNAVATTGMKGKIDLVNREGSGITLKPTIRNLTGTVTGVRFGDDLSAENSRSKAEYGASDLFGITWDATAGVASVKAVDGTDYRVNGKYKVTPIYTLSTPNGEVEVTAKPITITTKQTLVKMTSIPAMEVKLSAPDVTSMASMTVKSPSGAVLNGMKQLTQTENFEVNYDSQSGGLFVSIKDVSGLKAKKSYTIKMALDVHNSGVGAKQQTVNVKVKVLN